METELQSVQIELVPTRQKFSQQALIDDCHTQLVTNMRFLFHIQEIFSLPDIFILLISSFVTLHPGRVAIHWISVEPQCVQTNQPIWHNIERRDCFLLVLSRHQNIKISQCIISKNGWVL